MVNVMNKRMLGMTLIGLTTLMSLAIPCYAWFRSFMGGTIIPGKPHLYDEGQMDTRIYIYIGGVTPSGKKVTVTITEDGETIWSGLLGAGQSSPQYDVDGYIRIYVTNDNPVTVSYWGYMYYLAETK